MIGWSRAWIRCGRCKGEVMRNDVRDWWVKT